MAKPVLRGQTMKLLFDLLVMAGPDGTTIENLKQAMGDPDGPVDRMLGRRIGVRLGTLSQYGLAFHDQANERWIVAPEPRPEVDWRPDVQPVSNYVRKPKPTVTESPVAALVRQPGEAVDVPTFRNGWLGVSLSVAQDPLLFRHVVRAEYSRDGEHFDPLPLLGNVRIHIGTMIPEWSVEQVTIRSVKCLRIEYMDGAQARRDSLDVNGRDVTIAKMSNGDH